MNMPDPTNVWQLVFENHGDDVVNLIVVDRSWVTSEIDHRLWEDDSVPLEVIQPFFDDPSIRPYLHAELAGGIMRWLSEDSIDWSDYIQTVDEQVYVKASRLLRSRLRETLTDEQTRLEIYAKVKARQVEAEQTRTSRPSFPITILNERTGLIAEPMEVVLCRT